MQQRGNVRSWKIKAVWRTLSSGAEVLVKRVALAAFVSRGDVPQTLFAALVGSAPQQGTTEAIRIERKPGTVGARAAAEVTVDPLKLKPEEIKDFYAFARAVVRGALVWPKVVDSPSEAEDEITLDEIPETDLFEIMSYAINETPVATTDGEVSAEALRKTDSIKHVQGDSGGVADVRSASG